MLKPLNFGVALSLSLAVISIDRGAFRAVGADPVVVYSALDREFSEPILDAYAKQAGVRVLSQFDVESTKTVGLTNLLIAESVRTRCDLFWNNEILNTIRLKEKGCLRRTIRRRPTICRPPSGPRTGRGTGSRPRPDHPGLTRSSWPRPIARRGSRTCSLRSGRGRSGSPSRYSARRPPTRPACSRTSARRRPRPTSEVSRPTVCKCSRGNKQVAQAVGSGQIAFGLTDTDDAIGEIDAGNPVAIVYPDREADGLGTLFIPNTLAILKGQRRTANRRRPWRII